MISKSSDIQRLSNSMQQKNTEWTNINLPKMIEKILLY
jgi:hypothetical protein